MKTLNLTENLYEYLLTNCPAPNPVLADLIEETSKIPMSQMQISPDQGGFLYLLAKILNASKIIEVGCFTGYSAICMASGLSSNGKLVTLDINPETTAVAKKYFKKSGLDAKIELRLGAASDSFADLEREWGAQTVDMVFIDADKVGMIGYYESALKMLRPGGLIVGDNVLWSGSVIDENIQDESTVAIRDFNKHVAQDERVDRVMLSVSDGLFLAYKK